MQGSEVANRFFGKSILITGGAGDIGRITAKRFSEEGATIVLLDIDEEKLNKVEEELRNKGAKVHKVVCNITDYHAVEKQLSALLDADISRIDFLFNNAGYQGEFKMAHQYPSDDFQRVVDINIVGAFHVLKFVSAHMVEMGGGAIVNTASMAGVHGAPNMIAYAASKSAVIGMTETACRDLAPFGIRVNAISPALIGPGYMWDRQVKLQAATGSQYYDADPQKVAEKMINSVPMRRYGSIEEIPGVVAFLMSEDASYVSGENILITGGML